MTSKLQYLPAIYCAFLLLGESAAAAEYLTKADYAKLCATRSEGDRIDRGELAKILVERANISFDTLASISAPWDAIKRNDYELLMVDPCLGPAGNPASCQSVVKPDAATSCSGSSNQRKDRFCRNGVTLKKANQVRDELQRQLDDLRQQFRSPAEPDTIYFGLSDRLIKTANPNIRPGGQPSFAQLLYQCEQDAANGHCKQSSAATPRVVYAYSETDYAVLCGAPPAQAGKEPGAPDGKELDSKKDAPLIAFSQIRVRGKLDDLGKPSLKEKEIQQSGSKKKKELARFKSLSAAKISLRHDEANDKDTFAIKGAVGVPIHLPALTNGLNKDDRLKLLAFTEYERSQSSGAESGSDIHAVAPGLKMYFDRPGFAQIAFDAKYTADLKQESKKLVGVLSASRTFDAITLFQRKYPPIDHYFPPEEDFNPESGMYFVPSFQARLEASDILDPGMDMNLASAESYYAVGGKAGLSVGAFTPSFLKNFTAGVDIEYLEFFEGDIVLDNITRFSANLRYSPPGAEHLFLQFEYVNGENLKTFQDEEYFDISVGIRY